ncbi:MAG TPA: thiamine pyrophosphate-binding protein [Thermomicrobiales bacterium]|nr:thiamine pyrophosphate-binding protein [Thermomicrobiales bacterium]
MKTGVFFQHRRSAEGDAAVWKGNPRMRQSPAQIVVESLRRNGVDTVFGLDGDHVIYLYDALSDAPDIRVVTVMHENNASIAAELYARVTGRPGVVLVTAGPGATNSLSGIAGAYAAGVPIVHISGGVPEGAAQEAFHGVDDVHVLRKVFEPVTKMSVRIDDAREIPDAIDRAFATATSGRPGPAHVEIAVSALTSGNVEPTAATPQPAAAPRTPDTTSLAARIDAAASIALVAGKNAFWPEVSDDLVSLAEHLQAPVAHVWDSHGAMPTTHPLSLGLWRDGNSNEFVDAAFDGADLVLGVGVRRGNESGITLARRLGERFAIIDAVDEPLDDGHVGAASVEALARTLRSLTNATRERPQDTETLERCAEAKRLFDAGMQVEMDRYRDEPAWPISLALHSLARRMTPDTIVVSDVSNVKIWAPLQLPTFDSLSHLQSGSWGSMGYTVPGVLGAAIGRPDRKVVGIVGDASFLMGSNDFGTICALGLPVVIAVHADRQIGMIYYSLKHTFNRTYMTDVPAVDFVAYAEAFGGRGIRVERPEQIDAAWDEALAADGPVLLEIRAGHDFPRPYPTQRIIDQGRERLNGG